MFKHRIPNSVKSRTSEKQFRIQKTREEGASDTCEKKPLPEQVFLPRYNGTNHKFPPFIEKTERVATVALAPPRQRRATVRYERNQILVLCMLGTRQVRYKY
jgi:hypothetical protein